MWTTPNPVKLENEELKNVWSWFTDWHGFDDGDVPYLTEEDYEMICNSVKRLFDHIAYLENVHENVHEIAKQLASEIKLLKLDFTKLKDRKRKEVATPKVDENTPNKRSRRR
jgi:hypothetical protein